MKIKLTLIVLCCILTCSILPSPTIGDTNQFASNARFFISLPTRDGNALYTNYQGYYIYGYFTNSYAVSDEYIIINTYCERLSYGKVSDVKEGMTILIPKRIAPLIQEINRQTDVDIIVPSDNVTK